MDNLAIAIVVVSLLIVYATYSLTCVWYNELHHGGWDDPYKPRPTFIFAMIGIIFLAAAAWIALTAYSSAMERQAEALLNPPMCVSETGHKPMPCPTNGER